MLFLARTNDDSTLSFVRHVAMVERELVDKVMDRTMVLEK